MSFSKGWINEFFASALPVLANRLLCRHFYSIKVDHYSATIWHMNQSYLRKASKCLAFQKNRSNLINRDRPYYELNNYETFNLISISLLCNFIGFFYSLISNWSNDLMDSFEYIRHRILWIIVNSQYASDTCQNVIVLLFQWIYI